MAEKVEIGTHLATLNLFREPDGKVYITVAESNGAIAEMKAKRLLGKPIDYVEGLVYDAANSTLKAHSRGRPNEHSSFCSGRFGGDD
jgi:hypothetical protein